MASSSAERPTPPDPAGRSRLRRGGEGRRGRCRRRRPTRPLGPGPWAARGGGPGPMPRWPPAGPAGGRAGAGRARWPQSGGDAVPACVGGSAATPAWSRRERRPPARAAACGRARAVGDAAGRRCRRGADDGAAVGPGRCGRTIGVGRRRGTDAGSADRGDERRGASPAGRAPPDGHRPAWTVLRPGTARWPTTPDRRTRAASGTRSCAPQPASATVVGLGRGRAVVEAVLDHLEGQEVLPLLAEHPPQSLHVVLVELAVARRASAPG